MERKQIIVGLKTQQVCCFVSVIRPDGLEATATVMSCLGFQLYQESKKGIKLKSHGQQGQTYHLV